MENTLMNVTNSTAISTGTPMSKQVPIPNICNCSGIELGEYLHKTRFGGNSSGLLEFVSLFN
jgi:hypothetical protein